MPTSAPKHPISAMNLARRPAVVVAGHPLTAAAAETLLREGGNAFDAIAAAYFVSCFAEPLLASVGGGGFFMLEPVNERPRVLDCFAQTPRVRPPSHAADVQAVEIDFGSTTQTFRIGWGTVAVPGMVRGIYAMHDALGHVPLRDIIRAAIDVGRAPIAINACQAEIFEAVTPICLSRPAAARQFSHDGQGESVASEGDSLNFDNLADTLDVLAIEGEDFYYRGEIASLFENEASHGGGSVRRIDLERYQAVVREAESVGLGDARVVVPPAPSAGGMLVAFGLSLIDEKQFLGADTNDADRVRMIVEILKSTAAARLDTTDLDQHDWPDSHRLLAQDYIMKWRQQLLSASRAWRGTTHMSVIDSAGNIAALTTSNGAGCGDILGGTGIMPNNMLGEDDLNPRGSGAWEPNTRMSSMMMPTIIMQPDGTRTVIGSGGSNRIRSAMLQVIVNLQLLKQPLEVAVDAPRVHVDGDTLMVEGGHPESVVARLLKAYPGASLFDDRSFYFGGVHVAHRG